MLLKTVIKLHEYTGINFTMLRNLSALDPSVMDTAPKKAIARFSAFISNLIQLKLISSADGDVIKDQFKSCLELPALILFRTKDKSQRLDEFFFGKLQVEKRFPKLSVLMKIVCTLSHGQASVERGFSFNKGLAEVNLAEKSLVSRRMISDYMH